MCKPSLGSCPVAMAVGETTSGKSTVLKLICKLLSLHMVSQSSAEFVVSHLTKTTIPLGWDDPTHASVLKHSQKSDTAWPPLVPHTRIISYSSNRKFS